MENQMERRYGLITAICMVVGIVIGSGVFFKAQVILQKTGGNMPMGVLSWIIGGAIMLICILAFANMATKYEKVNGVVDYAEATVGGSYAYYIGWFMTTIYYPTLTSVLAWLSARYTLVFITSVNPDFPLLIPASEGGCVLGPECMALMLFYMCCAYAVNALSPKLAGKIQVSCTFIKLVPLALMAVVGVLYGMKTGMLANNFSTTAVVEGTVSTHPLLVGVCATSFAYEGWIIATAINSELKDAKRNLPRALIIGALITIATYIAYFVGVAGGATNQELIDLGATTAFINIFGNVLGNILNLFIAISCIGTMNGLMLGCCRGLYSVAVRGKGPAPKMFAEVDRSTNIPGNSAVVGLLLCGLWGTYFFLGNLSASPASWFGKFCFDSSELPIVTTYLLYIPIFVMWMKKEKGESLLKRIVIPALAIAGSMFMVYACIASHKMACLYYVVIFAAFMAVGVAFRKRKA